MTFAGDQITDSGNTMSRPVISFITVCYGNPEELRMTIKSVYHFLSKNIELIIIDGSHTDSCHDVLSSYPKIKKYLHEKDHGKYDAMNKGVALACGKYVLFLNSGDQLFEYCNFSNIAEILNFLEKPHLVYGDIIIGLDSHRYYKKSPFPSDLNLLTENPLPSHQAILFPAELFETTLYDTVMQVSADTKLINQALTVYPPFKLDQAISISFIGGISNVKTTLRGVLSHWRERKCTLGNSCTYNELSRGVIKYYLMKFIGWRNYYLIIFFLKKKMFVRRKDLEPAPKTKQ